MSSFWGIYSRAEIPKLKERFLREVSGNEANDVSSKIFSCDKMAAVKCDVGAFGDRGFYKKSDMGFCLVAGNPILTETNGQVSRNK